MYDFLDVEVISRSRISDDDDRRSPDPLTVCRGVMTAGFELLVQHPWTERRLNMSVNCMKTKAFHDQPLIREMLKISMRHKFHSAQFSVVYTNVKL